MLVALAVMHGRQRINRQIGGQLAQSVAQQQIVDQRVGCQRQVRAVLFDGRGGENQKRGLARERVHLLPIQIGEVSRVRNPGFHFVVCSGGRGFRMERDHLPRIEQSLGVVALLGEQLDVVGAIPPASFDIVHVRVRHPHSNLEAEIDHFVQALLGRVVHHGDRAREHAAIAALHEFHVEQNLLPETLAQSPQLFSRSIGIKAALQIRVGAVRSHRPERCVIPGVVGKQRPRVKARIHAAMSNRSSCVPRGGFQSGKLAGSDHEKNKRVAFRRILQNRREERRDRPLENGYQPFDPCRVNRNFLAEIESGAERAKRHDALRPFHGRRQRKPYSSDDAVGSPGMQNLVYRFALVQARRAAQVPS